MRDDLVTEIEKIEMPTPAICASIIGEKVTSMKKDLETALEFGADILELRIDRLKSSKNWKRMIKQEVPTIVTNRTRREGGYFEGKEGERIESLIDAIEEGADFVDIEFSTPEKLRERVLGKAEENKVSTVMSFHDFDRVPPKAEMMRKVGKMERAGCDLAKIIGFADDADGAIRMLDFLIQASGEIEVPIIAFAMGEEGKITRLAAPLLGSPITYASIEKKAAPGQIDLPTMRGILDKFRN